MNKKRYYQYILRTILRQDDIENKNPVDVGIECGYSEEDVVEAIRLAYEIERSKSELLYFIVGSNVVSLNTFDWSVSVEKKIQKWYKIAKVQKGIWVIAYEDLNNRNKSNKWNVEWENLRTEEKGTFHTQDEVGDIIVIEDGLVIASGSYSNLQVIRYYFDQRETKIITIDSDKSRTEYALRIENDIVYVVTKNKIWRIGETFAEVEKTANWENSIIKAFCTKDCKKTYYIKWWKGDSHPMYKYYTLDGKEEEAIFPEKLLRRVLEGNTANLYFEEIIETQNYYFLNDYTYDYIYEKRTGSVTKVNCIVYGNTRRDQRYSMVSDDKVIYVYDQEMIVIKDLKQRNTMCIQIGESIREKVY